MQAERVVRRGTIFLTVDSAEEMATPDRYVSGYWDGLPDSESEGLIEQLPDGLSVHAALDWARQRSERVLIRNDDPTFPMPTGRHLWAGDGTRPPDVQRMP